MARIQLSKYGETPFQQLLGHHKKIMEAWSELGNELECDGYLSATLKEQVRRSLAQGNGCMYCKAKGKPDPNLFDEKTSIAVGFAEVFLKTEKGDIPDNVFSLLYETFSEEEISELCAFICFTTCQQYYGALMKLDIK
ncbi:carboxymuconolactone decarboxylase family protein [Ornithinibacillus sp. 179-J 7C1 HS]|uniref:carboxymuconolactone decarboxylase family protein n=1 Tax=Ornithinibacillus sp. 179-J 7C1 HS TaxID=3142384 RepID=UPI0039A097C7